MWEGFECQQMEALYFTASVNADSAKSDCGFNFMIPVGHEDEVSDWILSLVSVEPHTMYLICLFCQPL